MKQIIFIVLLFLFSFTFAENNVNVKSFINTIDTVNLSDGQVFLAVENPPEYPGGPDSLILFLAKNVRYPAAAREYRIEGKVFVSFIIEKNGSVSNVKVIRGIGGGCDEEAKRVISLLPNFIPGKQNGRAVRVYFNVPINFKLSTKH